MNYRRNRRYFATLDWTLITVLAIIGMALFYLFTAVNLTFILLISIGILLGLGVFIFLKYFNRPTDEDIDATYQEAADIAVRKGYQKLGLDPKVELELDPIVIHGPMVDPISFPPAIKKGKDGKVRSSNHEMIVLLFSLKQVYVYHEQYSLIDDESIDVTDEYFYDDIVSVSVASTATTYYEGRYRREEHFQHQTFKLIMEGRHIECAILDDEMIATAVTQMRNLLREKRGVVASD